MKKTLLVIPGLPRCATTSLINVLCQHPDVYRSAVKEPHTLIPDTRRESLFGFVGKKKLPFRKLGFLDGSSNYIDNFNGFSGHDVFIDASTLYSVHLAFIGELKKLSKENDLTLKFILLNRDPYDRAVSHYRFSVSRREEYRSFREAVESEVRGENGDWILGGYLKGGDSTPLQEALCEEFPNSDVIMVDIDNTNIRSSDFWDRVTSFLGLDSFNFDYNVYENKSEVYSNIIAITIRYWMKRIRDISPRFFEQPIFRKPFSFVMKLFSNHASKKDLEINMSKKEFMVLFDERQRASH